MDKYTTALRGGARLEITGANPEKVLNRCAQEGIDFIKAVPTGEFSIELTVKRRDTRKVYIISERCMCTAEVKSEKGIPVSLGRVKKRYALLLAPLLLIVFFAWSSLHIWEIEVIGNETVSEGEIIRALDKAGVKAGSYWPAFVSDNIRSLVMVEIPQLRWMTVNVYGSKAEILIRERTNKPEIFDEDENVHVVAGKPGIITETRVYRGKSEAGAGQTVAMGDIIVSGRVDSTYADTRTVHASADIWARTWYEMVMAAPLTELQKVSEEGMDTDFSVILGDKRINFYHNSGKEGDNYVKINFERRLNIAGMFSLPFTLLSRSTGSYALLEAELDGVEVAERLKSELLDALSRNIGGDGEITDAAFSQVEKDGMLYVTLRAECVENIAVERKMTEAELLEIAYSNAENEQAEEDNH